MRDQMQQKERGVTLCVIRCNKRKEVSHCVSSDATKGKRCHIVCDQMQQKERYKTFYLHTPLQIHT